MKKNYDFSGWATVVNRRCSDGRTILPGAFKDDDNKTVPLVWNHQHDDPSNVLGHAMLESRPQGMYARCTFNNTPKGQDAKEAVRHGDVVSLSIYANQLRQRGNDVVHGVIREVSLVLAGANPDAFIDTVLVHADGADDEEEGIIYFGEGLELSHSDKGGRKEADDKDDEDDEEGEEEKMDDNKKRVKSEDEETVADVFNTLTDKQKTVVYALIGQAMQDADEKGRDENDEEEEDRVKHNIFDSDEQGGAYLSHADMQVIMTDAKRIGSLKEAVVQHMESGVLAHVDVDTTGLTTPTGNAPTYGIHGVDMLFPDYRALSNEPEWVARDMGWVKKVLNGVHHTPFSRIKSLFANITEDEARAKGYMKGGLKKDEVFSLLKRTTDPQTIYKRQKIDRDDIVDITDFDVVAWIKKEMRFMLDEEIARAILIGDGRLGSSDDKIHETHVRPIITDAPLFNTVVKVTVPNNADANTVAKAIINAAIKGRKNYRGSGNPTFFTTEDYLGDLLLLEDGIGHKLYRTEAELATNLRARELVTVEPMSGQTVEVDNEDLPLIGVLVNLIDYNVGADKGGDINLFDDFDIDYNANKYLIETRISGALTKPFSALTLVLDRQSA